MFLPTPIGSHLAQGGLDLICRWGWSQNFAALLLPLPFSAEIIGMAAKPGLCVEVEVGVGC